MAARKTANTKAVENAKTEATDVESPRTFEYKGETYTVPGLMDMPVEVLELEDVEDVNPTTLARAIIGEEQWAKFKATGAKVRDFNDFLALVLGEDLGK
ncbi:hypothetical protein [Streptomyces sp. URMC 125]|uniref:hypothetical protein n=1 Tax=Streptomyces sp. URMC 125 TaxID=3423419 RepID=UPI003F1B1843